MRYGSVEPAHRAARVERALRWYATDARDGNQAIADLGRVTMPRPFDVRLADFGDTAKRAGTNPGEAVRRMSSTAILRAADASTPSTLGALFPWRLCSVFAYGRPWASIGSLERETVRTVDSNVLHLRMTRSLDRVLYPGWAGLELVEFAVNTYARRAASPH